MGRPFPLKIAPSYGGSGPTRVLNPNGISIGTGIFAGLTSMTDRQTDRQTDHAIRSLTIGSIYVRSTAMRPNNYVDIRRQNLTQQDTFVGV